MNIIFIHSESSISLMMCYFFVVQIRFRLYLFAFKKREWDAYGRIIRTPVEMSKYFMRWCCWEMSISTRLLIDEQKSREGIKWNPVLCSESLSSHLHIIMRLLNWSLSKDFHQGWLDFDSHSHSSDSFKNPLGLGKYLTRELPPPPLPNRNGQ